MKLSRNAFIAAAVFVSVLLAILILPNETGQGTATDYLYGYEMDSGKVSFWLYNDNPSGGLFGFWSYSAIYSVDTKNKELLDKLICAYEHHDLVRIQYKNIRHPYFQYASETVIYDVKILED